MGLNYLENIINKIPKNIKKIFIKNNEIVIEIKNKNELNFILFFFKNNTNLLFKSLIDITCVDFIKNNKRFEISYNILSYIYNSRLRLKLKIGNFEKLNSISNIYSSACWLEREIWDLFGVYIDNHPDLRRILTDYGFEGFPLRKDFPLTGFIELRYDDEEKCIVYESLEISQSFRFFNFLSPWDQINNYKNFIK